MDGGAVMIPEVLVFPSECVARVCMTCHTCSVHA